MNSTNRQADVSEADRNSVKTECWDLQVRQSDRDEYSHRSLPYSRYWVFSTIFLALLLTCFASGAFGQSQRNLVTHDDLNRGGFAFRTVEGELELAPILASEADYQVDGILARARITQHFINPYDE